MQYNYALIFVEAEKSVRERFPQVKADYVAHEKQIKTELENYSFDDALRFAKEKRKPTQYQILFSALVEKVRRTIDRYGSDNQNATEEYAKFESWSSDEVFLPEEILENEKIFFEKYYPHAIVQPDGSWTGMNWDEHEEKNEKIEKKWDAFILKTLTENKNKSLILVITYFL